MIATADEKPQQPAPRSTYSFGLRGLLIFMAVGGLGLAYVVYPLHQWWRQSQSVAVIKAHGGEFFIHEGIWEPWREGKHWCKAVSFNRGFSTDPHLRKNLQALPKLEHLSFSGPSLAKEDHTFIGTLSGLKSLEIQNARRTTDSDLAPLAKLRWLKRLWLSGSKIDGTGLAHLRHLTHLRELQLNGSENLSVEGMRELGKLSQLNTLSLCAVPLTNEQLEAIASLQQLQSLSLDQANIDDQGMEAMSAFRKLRRLTMQHCNIGNDGLRFLRGMHDLEYLNLFGTRVTDDGIKHLSALPKLKHLHLGQLAIQRDALTTMTNMPSLQVVIMIAPKDPKAIESFGRMPQLQELWLSNVTDAHMSHLPPLPKIKTIHVSGAELTDAGLMYLRQYPYRVHVHVTGKKLTQEGIKKARPSGGYSFDNRF